MTRFRTLAIPALCALLGLLFTALACYQLDAQFHRGLETRFDAASREIARGLQQQLDEDGELLATVAAYRRNSPNGNLNAFLEQRLQERPPAALRAISLAPLVLAEGRDSFIATHNPHGAEAFTINPSGVRPLYAPITLSHGPLGQLGLPAGLDLLSDPAQQETLSSARDSGLPTLSGRVTLPGYNGEQIQAFIMSAPLFSANQPQGNVGERRASIEAWIVASFSLKDWVSNALDGLPEGIAVSLRTGEASLSGETIYPDDLTAKHAEGRFVSERSLSFGERRWTARIVALPGFLESSGGNPAKHVALLGLVLMATLFSAAMYLATSRRRAQAETARLQESLAESEERWRFALEGSGEGVWDWDIRTGTVTFSPRCDVILGMSDGKAAQATIHPEDENAERAAMQACLEGRSAQYTSEHRMQGEDGQWRWIAARGMVTRRTIAGAAARMTGTMSDITASKAAQDKQQEIPQLDSLTGLPNRTLFFDRLQQGLRLVKRQRETLALIYADVDNFKGIIDNFGQTVSHKLLREVARRISESVRDSDSVAHMGRNDFAVFLPSLKEEQDVHIVLDKIREALAADFIIHDRPIGITLSYGIAFFPQHARSAETLVNAAQRAMQQASKDGGNMAVFSLPEQI